MLVIGPEPERHSLLIDAGEVMGGDGRNHERIGRRLEELLGTRSLDTVLLSHFHGDHTGFARNGARQAFGLFGLIEAGWTVDTLLDRGDGLDRRTATRSHRDVMREAPRWIDEGLLGERVAAVAGETRIDLGGSVDVEVLVAAGCVAADDPGVWAVEPGAEEQRGEEQRGQTLRRGPVSENDFSIGLELSLGDFELFTAGDLNGALQPEDGAPRRSTKRFFGERFTNVEQHLLDGWSERESDVEVYRANHHGSRFSTTQALLDALDPELIVYSTGGQYGHPTRDVVRRGAATAEQLVTSAVSATSWPRGLPSELGRVAGEVVIAVDPDGRAYTVNGERRRAFSDEAERIGEDAD